MSDQEEKVDIYNSDGEIIDVKTRHEADSNNLCYPNAIVFVFTKENTVWIQKRSIHKKHYPGLWDTSACGAIAHGEDPKVAAERELAEEMNIKCSLTFVKKFLNIFTGEGEETERRRISHIFIGTTEETPRGNDEVEAVAVFDADELLFECQNRPDEFLPSFDIEYEIAYAAYKKLLQNSKQD